MRFPWSSLQLIGTSCRVRRAQRLTGGCSSQRRRTSSETTSQRLRGSGWGDPEGVRLIMKQIGTHDGVFKMLNHPFFLIFWNCWNIDGFWYAGAILGAMHLSMKKCQVNYQTWDLISQHYNCWPMSSTKDMAMAYDSIGDQVMKWGFKHQTLANGDLISQKLRLYAFIWQIRTAGFWGHPHVQRNPYITRPFGGDHGIVHDRSW